MRTDIQRLLLLLVIMAISALGWAQVSNYTFTSSVGTFTEISGGTIHGTAGMGNNEMFTAIPIGFNFTYNGIVWNEVSIISKGFLAFGNTIISTNTPISTTTSSNNVIAAMTRDIQGRVNSELMTLTSGSAPNRVFTVQWKHFRRVQTTAANDDWTFQIRLNESNGSVVLAYGNVIAATVSTAQTLQVGLRGNDTTDYNNRTTTTDWTASDPGTANNATMRISGICFPPLGLLYTFMPPQIGQPPMPAQIVAPINNAQNISINPTLRWISGGGTVDGYKVYLGTDNPPTNVTNGAIQTELNYNTPILNYSTQYYWRIVPFNNFGDATGVPVWSFTTMADPTITTYPYTQNFDTVTLPALPLGWFTINANDDLYTWETVAGTAHTTPNSARIRYNITVAMNDWLVMPPLHFTQGTIYRISFYYRAHSATYPERMAVYLGNAPTAAAMTNQIFNNNNIITTTYTLGEAFVTATQTGAHYVGFHGYSAADRFYIYLDTIQVEAFNPTFNPPQNLTGTPGNNVVNLAWQAPANRALSGYKVFRNGTEIASLPTTPLTYSDTNVVNGTTYTYHVTAVYTNPTGESDPSNTVTVMPHEPWNPPTNFAVQVVNYNTARLTWTPPGGPPPPAAFTDGFETYPNFANTFAPWVLVDVDGSNTYGIVGTTFPGQYQPMAYIIFNPTATTPPMTALTAHSGNKMAACFASTTAVNNDWLISPLVTIGPGFNLSFWAKSYTAQYGLERFRVGVSTGGTTPADFTIISGPNYIQAPVDWTQYSYSMAAYTGQTIRFAIRCVSDDAFIFFVDSVYCGPGTANFLANEQPPAQELALGKMIGTPTSVFEIPTEQVRVQTGYKIHRNGTLVHTITDPSAATWDDVGLPWGTYSYTVTATYTHGDSQPAGPVTINVLEPLLPPTNLQASVAGDDVTLTWTAPVLPINNIRAQFPGVGVDQPDFDFTRALIGYTVYRGGNILETLDANTLTYVDTNLPNGTYQYTVTAVYTGGESPPAGPVTAVVNVIDVPLIWNDGFENYPNFSLTFNPWTLFDIDGSGTYGFSTISFPNAYSPMAYIIFNPGATTPPMTDLPAQEGSKFAASFASTTPPNNDWMITPRFNLGTQSSISFWAKSYTAQYGLERFKVGVSTTTATPAAMTVISPGNYVQAPVQWTLYTYDLSAYNGQNIHVGIHCVSNDAFIFCVDNFKFYSVGGSVSNDDNTAPVARTGLIGNYPNPFNPSTTIAFSMKESAPVRIDVYNMKGQLVKTLVDEIRPAGNHTVFWNGMDNNNRSISSGVYFYKMTTGKFTSTRKMILLK